MTEQKRKKIEWKYWLIGIVSFGFYVLWYLLDGIIQTPDANSYISMEANREPGYCMYLAFFRVLFPADCYLDAAVLVQCLIAAVAAAAICKELQKRFALHDLQMLCILMVQYGLTLLNRFVAQRRYSYFNSIETEGITYSLWIFLFVCLIRILYDAQKKDIIQALIWCVVLTTIRKHMLISFGLFFLVIFYVEWKNKKWKKGLIQAVVLLVLGLSLMKLLDYSYNYATRGVFASHTGDSLFILGTEIFVADTEMVSRIEKEEYQQLFLEIMKRADEKQYNLKYAESGWRNIERHYSNSYDRIKFDIINVTLNEYLDEIGMVQPQREEVYNEITAAMMKALLPACIQDMARISYGNVLHGFITTVLKVHPLLNLPALGLYMLYLGIFIYLIRQKSYVKVPASVLPFAGLVMLAIVANVFLTAVTIYSQMRYMLYNTGLFYQAGFLMLIETARIRRVKEEVHPE